MAKVQKNKELNIHSIIYILHFSLFAIVVICI